MSHSADIGDPVPGNCNAGDLSYSITNVVPNGVCTAIGDTINVAFDVILDGTADRYDLSIGYTEAGESTLIDVECLVTPYDINGGPCDDFESSAAPFTASSSLDVTCDVDNNSIVDQFLSVDFYLNWNPNANKTVGPEISGPKCLLGAGTGSIPLKPASLTLVKTVANDHGGTAQADAWTLEANLGGGAAALSGTTGISSSTLAAGTYVLSESG